MQIAIVGYGKMGKAIERLARKKGYSISCIINQESDWDTYKKQIDDTDVFVEFTQPESAYNNLERLMVAGKCVVCGTTGWLDKYPYIVDKCLKNKAAFLYASNFSVGVNILFEMNKQLAKWTSHLDSFKVGLKETHHIHKKDSPSGTAMTLLDGIIENNRNFDSWSESLHESVDDNIIPVEAKRIGEVYGIHEVVYYSPYDKLSIRHEALSRDGFASGALMAAEWLVGRHGIFTMQDVLRLV